MNAFGRLYAPDEGDLAYPLTAVPEDEIKSVQWGAPRAMNQGSQPWCVAYAWNGALAAYPNPRPRGSEVYLALPEVQYLYCRAQERDEWEGDCTRPLYDGTSVRAGAKVMQEMGLIREYRWAPDLDTFLRHLSNRGPLILGTRWTADMSMPDGEGIVHATGRALSGHAYTAVGYDAERDLVDCLNSWGRPWGPRGGRFWIPTADLALLIDQDGEACSPTELWDEEVNT